LHLHSRARLRRRLRAALDFFGALRARQHDATIRAWAASIGEEELAKRLRACIRAAPEPKDYAISDPGPDGITSSSADDHAPLPPAVEGLPDFAAAGSATLALLLEAGEDLVREQEAVNAWKLSEQYMKKMTGGASLLGFGG
jgi:hypothetical protein